MRNQRQLEAAETYLNTDFKSILNCCPRFGKIRTAIIIMDRIKAKNVLILLPRKDIIVGWESELKECNSNIIPTYHTFASIKKLQPNNWDLVIIDEPHELSVNQQKLLSPIIQYNKILGLTGTLTQKTSKELYDNLNLDVCYRYTIDMGVDEGILTDYEIVIHKIPLDNDIYSYTNKYGKSFTEKQYFDYYKKARDAAKIKYFMDLKLIQIIQNSSAKLMKTGSLIHEHLNERILVFCGTTAISDKLDIPVYHSKNKDKKVFDDFCSGKGNYLATIKMMQAGITVLPINRGIINYTSGNPEDTAQKICRFLGFEYDNPGKKAKIDIVCSTEEFEENRLISGLLFFDDSKISEIY